MAKLGFFQVLTCLAVLAVGLLSSRHSVAGGYCSELRLTCENGHSYPICPIAVSDQGELVTWHTSLSVPGAGSTCGWSPWGSVIVISAEGSGLMACEAMPPCFSGKTRPSLVRLSPIDRSGTCRFTSQLYQLISRIELNVERGAALPNTVVDGVNLFATSGGLHDLRSRSFSSDLFSSVFSKYHIDLGTGRIRPRFWGVSSSL